MELEIGRGKKARRAYGFDDIAIVPARRTRDPDDVDISWKLGPYRFEIPLLASAMDGVVSPSTATIIGRLGGLAVLYPPLIDEGASLEWTVETAVHEWLHQYLAFTPLGFRYVLDLTGVRPDYEIARRNETVAGMVGRELAQRVLEEYRRVAPPAPATAAVAVVVLVVLGLGCPAIGPVTVDVVGAVPLLDLSLIHISEPTRPY